MMILPWEMGPTICRLSKWKGGGVQKTGQLPVTNGHCNIPLTVRAPPHVCDVQMALEMHSFFGREVIIPKVKERTKITEGQRAGIVAHVHWQCRHLQLAFIEPFHRL